MLSIGYKPEIIQHMSIDSNLVPPPTYSQPVSPCDCLLLINVLTKYCSSRGIVIATTKLFSLIVRAWVLGVDLCPCRLIGKSNRVVVCEPFNSYWSSSVNIDCLCYGGDGINTTRAS